MKVDLLPADMRAALLAMDDPEWAEEMARQYLDADEESRADIRAFFDSGGPEMIEDAVRFAEHRAKGGGK